MTCVLSTRKSAHLGSSTSRPPTPSTRLRRTKDSRHWCSVSEDFVTHVLSPSANALCLKHAPKSIICNNMALRSACKKSAGHSNASLNLFPRSNNQLDVAFLLKFLGRLVPGVAVESLSKSVRIEEFCNRSQGLKSLKLASPRQTSVELHSLSLAGVIPPSCARAAAGQISLALSRNLSP